MTTQVSQGNSFSFAGVPLKARALLKLVERIEGGTLHMTLPNGATHTYGIGAAHAAVRFHDWAAMSEILSGGDVAFAESYMQGRWDTPDLAALLTLAAKNHTKLTPAFYGSRWMQWVFRFRHALRKNTKQQAKKNIVAHYDLGNDFYSLWLDETMSYSSALFTQGYSQDHASAQSAKYERALRELRLAPGAHILEIGCGWGGFAEHAAKQGYRVTGLTLSPSQLAYAQLRVESAGVAQNVHLFLRDYRDHQTRVDGIVSIEMVEAVGERFWKSYFRTISAALKPGGRACIQGITIAPERFEQYRSQSDFIQQYIFPGGMLPTEEKLDACANLAGLTHERSHWFGLDYAETLRRWLARFDEMTPQVLAQGKSETFVRMWRFYLAYCIAGFEAKSTDVGQFTWMKKGG
jgi:cyclopropane-fatty-acyl-phospholipid synthase